MREPLLVSACLLGICCNHRGASSPRAAVGELRADFRLIPVCPEVAGGLPVPRPEAELQPDGRVLTVDGGDVTDAYERGAASAVALAARLGATRAVLKARSPSCGTEQVYDGTFSSTLVAGAGRTADALRAAGLAVRSEETLGDWIPSRQTPKASGKAGA